MKRPSSTFAPSDAVTELVAKHRALDRLFLVALHSGHREQMRTVLQLAAEGKVRPQSVDRFPMEKAINVLELLAGGRLGSRGVLENGGS